MSGAKPLAWIGFGVALVVLVSPIKLVWAQPSLGWLAPFVLWLAVIGMGAWIARR